MGVRTEGDTVFVDHTSVEKLIQAMFAHHGCNEDEATTIAHRLVGANLRGHDSHGIIRSPRYIEWMDIGRVIPNAEVTVDQETAVFAVVNAR